MPSIDSEDEMRNRIMFKNLKNFTASKLTQFSSKYLVRSYNTDSSFDNGTITEKTSSPTLVWPPAKKHMTFSNYQLEQLQGQELFTNTLQEPEVSKKAPSPEEEASILVTGFGMRNASSLERILRSQKQPPKFVSRFQQKYYDLGKIEGEENYDVYSSRRSDVTGSSVSSKFSSKSKSTSETVSQTDSISSTKRSLEYLLGLEQLEVEEEMDEELISPEVKESEEYIYATSKSMREAQKYLRYHRVFEFFQLLIAHLLASKSDNPIEFLLDLLNQCLLYRSGLGHPPLLYRKDHIEQLFLLMDRMNTGFVELEQYHTAMKTLGICSYNEDPAVAQGNLVSKSVFIDEIYEAEIDTFNELIRRHRPLNRKPSKDFGLLDKTFPNQISQETLHLIPSTFFNKEVKERVIYAGKPDIRFSIRNNLDD